MPVLTVEQGQSWMVLLSTGTKHLFSIREAESPGPHPSSSRLSRSGAEPENFHFLQVSR